MLSLALYTLVYMFIIMIIYKILSFIIVLFLGENLGRLVSVVLLLLFTYLFAKEYSVYFV